MNLKLYGLFGMSYDYYTWETLNCVSEDVDKLRFYAGEDEPELDITTEAASSNLFGVSEIRHWYIREVKAI